MTHTHVLNLFGGEKAELDFLYVARRRAGVLEVEVSHFGLTVFQLSQSSVLMVDRIKYEKWSRVFKMARTDCSSSVALL